MRIKPIQVPAALLLDPELTPAEKLVWVAVAMGPGRPAVLGARVGLSRTTVRNSLISLAAAGWPSAGTSPPPAPASPAPAPRARQAALPIRLLEDPHIGAPAKVLFGTLQLTPEPGRFTYAGLSALTHTDPRTLKVALAQLAEAGWAKPKQPHKHAPVTYRLTRPPKSAELIRTERRVERATYKGETLMREYLNLLIDRTDYEDDATPDFLENPLTEQPLELDRFYPPDIGFEFQGPQHYHETDIYTRQQAKKQRARDHIKAGLCRDSHVTLVYIHAEDLTLETMQQKIPAQLPRRPLTGAEDLIRFLERRSAEHRESAAKRRRPAT